MTDSDLNALREQITASPALRRFEEQLRLELSNRIGATGVSPDVAMLDPITILMIISVVLQVIRLCRDRNRRPIADIAADLRAGLLVPPQRTMRLRRRLNILWREYCQQHNLPPTELNLFLAAVYAVSATVDDDMVAEFMTLA
jgi:hypothetical protein